MKASIASVVSWSVPISPEDAPEVAPSDLDLLDAGGLGVGPEVSGVRVEERIQRLI